MRGRLAALLCLMLLLCGCGTQRPAAGTPELILRYADNQPADYPTTAAARYFAQLVGERTQGRIKIRVYDSGELGDEASVLEQVQIGGIDFARVSAGTMADQDSRMELLSLPFLYRDAAHMWRVLDGSIGDDFLAGVEETGVVGLSWYDAGARSFYTRTPIRELSDLEGLTIRVQESGIMSRTVRLLGAIPVQFVYGEVYSAMQTGRIDGAENNLPSYASTGHCEVAPFFLRDEHTRLPEMQIMSTVARDKIGAVDESFVDIVAACARESALYERELWQQEMLEAERAVVALGCNIVYLSGARLDAFREAVQPIYDNLGAEEKAMVERIQLQ